MIFRITGCNFYIRNICVSVGKSSFSLIAKGFSVVIPQHCFQKTTPNMDLGTFNLPINKTLYNENFGYQRNFPSTLVTLTIKRLLLVSHFCKCRRQWAHKLLTHRITFPFVLSSRQFLPQTIRHFLQKLGLKVLTQALLELCSSWKLRKSGWGGNWGVLSGKRSIMLTFSFQWPLLDR